jgi:phenylalanyl-tRNA synthetase alpha subunit
MGVPEGGHGPAVDGSDPFTAKPEHVANYIASASTAWVQSINDAQTVTAQLNNVISQQLMKLYSKENKALNSIMTELIGASKKWGTKSIGYHINEISMNLQTTQKKWDNQINTVQTTAQQQTSQMSAQGNDSNQATTSAGLMAQLMQTITNLISSSL